MSTKSRVTVILEMHDDDHTSDLSEGQTLRWGRTLDDANPAHSAGELETALSQAADAFVEKLTRLRGNARIGEHVIDLKASNP